MHHRYASEDKDHLRDSEKPIVDTPGTNLFIPTEEIASNGRHHRVKHHKYADEQKDHMDGGLVQFKDDGDAVGSNLLMPEEEIVSGGRHHSKGHRQIASEAAVDHLADGFDALAREELPHRQDQFAEQKKDHFDAGEAQLKPREAVPRSGPVYVVDELGSGAAPIAPGADTKGRRRVRSQPDHFQPDAPVVAADDQSVVPHHRRRFEIEDTDVFKDGMGAVNPNAHNVVNSSAPAKASAYSNETKWKRTELWSKSQINDGIDRTFYGETTTKSSHHGQHDTAIARQQPTQSHRHNWGNKIAIADSEKFYGQPTSRDTHSPDKAHDTTRNPDFIERRNKKIDADTVINPRRFFDSNFAIHHEGDAAPQRPQSASRQAHQHVTRNVVPQAAPHPASHGRFWSSSFSLSHDSGQQASNHWRTSNGATGSASRSHHLYD